MTTLLLTDCRSSDRATALPTLRTRLQSGWALLFSHPNDFARYDLESDRWLSVMQRSFEDRNVRAVTVTRDATVRDQSWVSQLCEQREMLCLESKVDGSADMIDLRARSLQDHLESTGRRFVMLVDSLLGLRKTFVYETRTGLPSPLDFLAWVDTLNKAALSRVAVSAPAVAQPARLRVFRALAPVSSHPRSVSACSPTPRSETRRKVYHQSVSY